MELKVKLLDPHCMPYKKYETDSGFDVKARIPKLISLSQHTTEKFPIGIAIQIPDGHEAQIRPRSGIASKGVTAELGTIDKDYRGEISVILTNNSTQPFHINPYDRIAQIVIVPVTIPTLHIVSELDETDRGEAGFGSTGIA